jgi:hypothetical protein
MIKKLTTIYSLFLFLNAGAQNSSLILEKWDVSPVLHTIDNKYAGESAVILLDKRRVEYIDEKDELITYRTLHKIIHINNDNGIEAFNRVYLPVNENKDIVSIKARTVLPGGKIVEISSENIKDIKDEDEQMYKIFAMEGLVKGCEVEFYYTYRRNTGYFGRENIQGTFPVLEAKMEIVSPARLIYDLRPYNTTMKPEDTVINEKRFVAFLAKDIPGVEEEKYSAFEANLLRCEYKLSYNLARSKNEKLFTWDELAKRAYSRYTTCTEKELKKVDALVDDMKLKKLGSDLEKIIATENYLKKNFAAREDIDGEDAENLEKITKTKLASYNGIVRLYGAIFRNIGINHEFVMTGDRQKLTIERNFENWNNCDKLVLFFPALKKYLAPTEMGFRFPWINPTWGNANAIYCKSTTISNFTTAFAEIKNIPLEDYLLSTINTDAEIEMNNAADTLLINIKQSYSGYAASTYKSLFTFSSPENQRLVIKEMIKFGTKSENVVSSKLENQEFENYHENKPFILTATVKASELVERAGNKIIVKIGDIIGPQVEMYQEKPRQFPMDIDFPHILARKIKFTIPAGYIVKNPDDLNIDHTYKESGQLTMGFVSSYKIEGNTLTITIMEEYRKTNYPLSQYDEFRKIINAAADFNKVALVLEKK